MWTGLTFNVCWGVATLVICQQIVQLCDILRPLCGGDDQGSRCHNLLLSHSKSSEIFQMTRMHSSRCVPPTCRPYLWCTLLGVSSRGVGNPPPPLVHVWEVGVTSPRHIHPVEIPPKAIPTSPPERTWGQGYPPPTVDRQTLPSPQLLWWAVIKQGGHYPTYPTWCYRSGTVNSKSFVGTVLLRIKWKFELN